MTSFIRHLRALLAVAVLGVAFLAVPAVADAAKLKIRGSSVAVNDDGVAAIGLTNPNRSAARGTLTLTVEGTRIGRRSFSIPARRSRTVSVPVSLEAALALVSEGALPAVATATARGKGTSRKGIVLTYAGGGSGSGEQGGSTGNVAPPAPSSPEGYYDGTTSQNDRIFMNVVGNQIRRASIGGLGTCVDLQYGRSTQETNYISDDNLQVEIGPDGRFEAQSAEANSDRFKISGQFANGGASGTAVLNWEELRIGAGSFFYTVYCEAEVTWTAQRVGPPR